MLPQSLQTYIKTFLSTADILTFDDALQNNSESNNQYILSSRIILRHRQELENRIDDHSGGEYKTPPNAGAGAGAGIGSSAGSNINEPTLVEIALTRCILRYYVFNMEEFEALSEIKKSTLLSIFNQNLKKTRLTRPLFDITPDMGDSSYTFKRAVLGIFYALSGCLFLLKIHSKGPNITIISSVIIAIASSFLITIFYSQNKNTINGIVECNQNEDTLYDLAGLPKFNQSLSDNWQDELIISIGPAKAFIETFTSPYGGAQARQQVIDAQRSINDRKIQNEALLEAQNPHGEFLPDRMLEYLLNELNHLKPKPQYHIGKIAWSIRHITGLSMFERSPDEELIHIQYDASGLTHLKSIINSRLTEKYKQVRYATNIMPLATILINPGLFFLVIAKNYSTPIHCIFLLTTCLLYLGAKTLMNHQLRSTYKGNFTLSMLLDPKVRYLTYGPTSDTENKMIDYLHLNPEDSYTLKDAAIDTLKSHIPSTDILSCCQRDTAIQSLQFYTSASAPLLPEPRTTGHRLGFG